MSLNDPSECLRFILRDPILKGKEIHGKSRLSPQRLVRSSHVFGERLFSPIIRGNIPTLRGIQRARKRRRNHLRKRVRDTSVRVIREDESEILPGFSWLDIVLENSELEQRSRACYVYPDSEADSFATPIELERRPFLDDVDCSSIESAGCPSRAWH